MPKRCQRQFTRRKYFFSSNAARLGKKRLAEANSVNNWEFNEWFHGLTGKPMGMAGQSWNAAMFLLAFHVLRGDLRFPEV